MIENKKVEKLLEDIKKLLMLSLIQKGAQGKDIAGILSVDPAVISRMMSAYKSRKKK